MMENVNSSKSTAKDSYSTGVNYLGYYNLLTVIIGSIFNIITFVVLCRPTFKNAQTRSTTHYMRALAVIDFIGLYGWNFDSYLNLIYGFTLFYTYTVASCKIFTFLNYFTLQTAAWLHVFVSFDRFLFLSNAKLNTWFNQSKNVLKIIGGIIVFFFLFNFHLLIFVCYEDSNGQVNVYSQYYNFFPAYELTHLVINNIIPSFLILSLNILSIYYLNRIRRTTRVQNSQIRHQAIAITLITTSFLFVITRTPTAIAYSFFSNYLYFTDSGAMVRLGFDFFSYIFPVLNFPLYLITFTDFRREFIRLLLRKQRVLPVAIQTIRPTGVQMQQRNIPMK
ncbi:unnamed protein product [Adineta steineri]|uniref:G-protein coupled receptors family 1 profile domain-containing protein n=1 Tax=Adineta steineri TaxID=433720 RepID=A0A819WPS3_9BILA|nr:unnamed protein product [Adineta steineri]CAF1498858.1 unnamed protein product [Adineta steineri]CAF4012696.1 unnamed protein product [Adineta steineri]CAF4128211.1 unnamed protein product [Adineta steineri]